MPLYGLTGSRHGRRGLTIVDLAGWGRIFFVVTMNLKAVGPDMICGSFGNCGLRLNLN